jgi:hypothetical protein
MRLLSVTWTISSSSLVTRTRTTLTGKAALSRFVFFPPPFFTSRLTCFYPQTYLLGYEFPSTLMLLGKRKVYFVVSASKGEFLAHFAPHPQTLTELSLQPSCFNPLRRRRGTIRLRLRS